MTAVPARPLSLGVLGAANIARAFIAAVRGSPKIDVAAVASRDPSRAAAFARDTGVARVHSSYDALLADARIEAVYVPLANTLHAQWAIRAAEAGKHVLCEKPLAASAHEARAMIAAAHRHGVHLVEAYPYRAQPQMAKLRELLAEGAIGRLRTAQASFGFPLSDPANIRMDTALAGGARMDAGSYPVSFLRMVAGERPRRVHALSRMGPTGVDVTTLATLEFASGLFAQMACSFETARHRPALLVGDAGTIATTYYNDTSAALPARIDLKQGVAYDTRLQAIETATASGFRAEAESFHDLVREGAAHWSRATPAESIDIAMTLDAIAQSARAGRAVDIDAGN
jgi:predicted dehydrogenase